MSTAKVAISLSPQLLRRVDSFVKRRVFPSRSSAIQSAVREKLDRMEHTRLARECAKLSLSVEQQLADEGLAADVAEWPRY